MDVKLYREILEFLNHQSEVIKSFEIEKEYYLKDKDIERFIQTLRKNLCLLEEKTNNIIDGSDKK